MLTFLIFLQQRKDFPSEKKKYDSYLKRAIGKKVKPSLELPLTLNNFYLKTKGCAMKFTKYLKALMNSMNQKH